MPTNKRKATSLSSSDEPEKKKKTKVGAKSLAKSKEATKKKTDKDTRPAKQSTKAKETTENGKAKSKPTKKTYPKHIQESSDTEEGADFEKTGPKPSRNERGELSFSDCREFRPNMTPKEVLQAGSFGGTYFRPIKSGVTGQSYTGVWKELPKDWLEGLNIGRQVSSSTYHEAVNTYKAKCGGSLQMWEESGWIHKQDPYGWFMWYCRFYQGRRTEDDDRQIGRWLRCAGKTGRWRNNLIAKCVRSGCAFDNVGVSPVVRQTLQHWGYKLNKQDHDAHAKKVKV